MVTWSVMPVDNDMESSICTEVTIVEVKPLILYVSWNDENSMIV